ncbi:MAG: ABC transporter permease [Verrucomicrobiota bacterium]
MKTLLRRIRAWFSRGKLEAEMAEEMRLHLERRVEENIAGGMTPEEARYTALRKFGGVEQAKELAREQHGSWWLEQARQDLRFAARACWKAPGFTAVTVLTLALGIGINTALFSVVYGVLLDPYPYAKSNEIWAPDLRETKTNRPWGHRYMDYQGMAQLPNVRTAMATGFGRATLSGGMNPEIVNAPRLTGNAFEFLGVPALLGRGFTETDYQASGEPQPVTVLTFKLWQRLFNGDRDVLGRTLTLDDQTHTIIGVMPPRFSWYTGDGLWLPMPKTDATRGVRPIVRLKEGASKEVADQQLFALLQAAAKETPGPFPKEGFSATFLNYLDVTAASGEMKSSLHLLCYAVGFLLLIACTNVANLQLARAAGRQREIAVRLAMGATRPRLVRQLLTESVGLAVVGGLAGVLFAFWLTQVVVALMPENYVPGEARVTMNGWVLAFSVGVSLLTGILFGLAPALQGTRPDLNEALKSGGHGAAAGSSGNRTRNTLVVVEVALSVVLLVGASLTIRGFVELQRVDRGFDTEQLLGISVPLNPKRYPTVDGRNGFARDLLARLRALPGVKSATLGAPAGMEAGSGVTIAGQPKIPSGVALNYVDADYVPTLGIKLLEGRSLTEQDIARGEQVAVITEAAAKLWTDGRSPIGRVVTVDSLVGGGQGNLSPPKAVNKVTVVGIVTDLRSSDKRRKPQPVLLVPYTLRGTANRLFLVRTHGDPAGIVNMVRAEVSAMDREQPVPQPIVLAEMFRQQEAQPRFNLALFTTLAGIALALAAAGIYSVLSYVVAQRTREIGVRMALGAARSDIARLVLGTGGRLLAVGLVVGIAASVALTQLVQSRVFNVPLLDPVALLAAVGLLTVAAALACLLPARRATKVDPMIALRAE